jgi:hypothetical protein
MSTYTITHAWRLDGYGVVQTLEDLTGLVDGSSFSISGLNQTDLNGSHTVWSLSNGEFLGVNDEGDLLFDYDYDYPNQVIFPDAGDDIRTHDQTRAP